MRTFVYLVAILMLGSAPTLAQSDSVDYLGTHPYATKQRTASGRKIVALAVHDGRLYAGYGDYGANTGPIVIAAFNPVERTFDSLFEANTEAIYNFRTIRGRMYAPANDRKSYAVPGDYAVRDTDGVWSNRNCGSTTHAYDIASLTASDLYIVGSQDARATVFRSTDDGATWRTILRDTSISGLPNDFARFYFAGSFEGKLYVQARDYYGRLHPGSKVFDGTTWSGGPDLFPTGRSSLGWRPDTFARRMIYRAWEPGGSSLLWSFDGATANTVLGKYVRDVVISDGFVHALVDSGYGTILIERSSDLQTWTRVGRVPFDTYSLAVLDGTYYLGTGDSKILRYVGPKSSVPVAGDQTPAVLRIWPNPAHGSVTIETSRFERALHIIDALGRLVKSHDVPRDGTVCLNVDNIPAGRYRIVVGAATSPLTVVR